MHAYVYSKISEHDGSKAEGRQIIEVYRVQRFIKVIVFNSPNSAEWQVDQATGICLTD